MFTTLVIAGKGRGKKLGFPTLNLVIPDSLQLKHGIYAGWIVADGQKYMAAFHFGPVPVFNETIPTLEAFLLDTKLASVPTEVGFEFIQYLRAIQNFATTDALVKQIKLDVWRTRAVLK